MADLVTLDEVKTALGIDPTDNRQDSSINAAIADASLAIRNYTERNFGTAQVTEERIFEYDGSGYLDIDDADAITAVAIMVPNASDVVLNVDEWTAMPVRRIDSPVFTYIIIPKVYPNTASAEMGFTRNYDTYVREHGNPVLPTLVRVTGTWGWPVVPADVKRATIWTIRDWVSSGQGSDDLQSESIEGYSRSWARSLSALGVLAIPNSARDLLVQYQREHV
jgi:hypothetical protein